MALDFAVPDQFPKTEERIMKPIKLVPILFTLQFWLMACAVEPKIEVPEAYKIGQKHYHRVCANCHGPDAMGGNRAPKLTQKSFALENYPDEKLVGIIVNGSSSGAMPAQKDRISKQEIQELIPYLRYMQKTVN